MGAGILPTCIYKNKLYFLFGKEGKFEDSAPGYSDFGGGTDNSESFMHTAIREASEELTGFLGNKREIQKMLKRGTYNIDYVSDGHKPYRMHIFYYPYNEWLPFYYNNNQQFLQKHLDENVLKKTKIFEKAEIAWIPVDRLKKMRPKFRCYFQNIVDMMIAQQDNILQFIRKRQSTKTRRATHTTTRTRKIR